MIRICFILFAVLLVVFHGFALQEPIIETPGNLPKNSKSEGDERISKLAEEVRENKAAFVKNLARNPLRVFEGKVVDLSHFAQGKKPGDFPSTDLRSQLRIVTGKVVSSTKEGLFLADVNLSPDGRVFFKNYPESVAIGVYVNAWGRASGSHEYQTPGGKMDMAPAYDFGTVPDKAQLAEFQEEQLQEERQRNERMKQEQAKAGAARLKITEEKEKQAAAKDASLLKFQMEQAEKGLPTFQYEMGLRYLEGRGVERNAERGNEWLKKAVEGGVKEARSKMVDLDK
ncbi:MAG: hypothetical protein JWM04_2789 [Verrucomicrobiales bacterium]|nr:hypothetical protein [Verrucomicrobiales bacterium]